MKNVLMLLGILVILVGGCTQVSISPNYLDANFNPSSSCTASKGCYNVLNHFNMGGHDPVLVHVYAKNSSNVMYGSLDGSLYSSLKSALDDSVGGFVAQSSVSVSGEDPSYLGVNIIDGNTTTQWRTGTRPDVVSQWVKLDLGDRYLINKITEGPLVGGRCTYYTISLSADDVNYETVVTVEDNPVLDGLFSNIWLGSKTHDISKVQARYVLYECTEARQVVGNVLDVARLTELTIEKVPTDGSGGREVNLFVPKCDASMTYPKPPSNQLTSRVGFIVGGVTSSPSGGEFFVNDVAFGNSWNIMNQLSLGQFLTMPISEGYVSDLVWDPGTSTNAKMQLWCV